MNSYLYFRVCVYFNKIRPVSEEGCVASSLPHYHSCLLPVYVSRTFPNTVCWRKKEDPSFSSFSRQIVFGWLIDWLISAADDS